MGKAPREAQRATHPHPLAVPSQGPQHHCSQTQYRCQAKEGEEGPGQVLPVVQVAPLGTSEQAEAQDSEDVHQDEEQDEHGGHGVGCLPDGGDERLQGRGAGLGKAAGRAGRRGQGPACPAHSCPQHPVPCLPTNGGMERWKEGREPCPDRGPVQSHKPSSWPPPSVVYGQAVCAASGLGEPPHQHHKLPHSNPCLTSCSCQGGLLLLLTEAQPWVLFQD